MNLNEYLIKNPKHIEGIFTKIFGKYLMRYYKGTEGYSVTFSHYEKTSYNDSRKKIICIAMSNVIELLKLNVPVLSIAYHELAHTLYTKQSAKNKIIGKVYDSWGSRDIDKINTIWNVIEDERIERKLVKDYDFLKEIMEPLPQIIVGDNLLFSWRNGEKEKAPQHLVDLCEEIVSGSRTTNDRFAEIIIELIKTYYPDGNIVQQTKSIPSPKAQQETEKEDNENAENRKGEKQETQEQEQQAGDEKQETQEQEQQAGDDTLQENETEKENDNESDSNTKGENENTSLNESDNDTEGEVDKKRKTLENEGTQRQINEQQRELNEMDNLDIDETQEVIRSILKDYQKDLEESREIEEYNDAIKTYTTPVCINHPMIRKVPNYYSAKTTLKNGMTLAQAKKYSTNITTRVSVPRIVESMANKKEPAVFYGKGKDFSFMRKVVIFEDISGSTQGFTEIFSSIALSLSKSFQETEWWGYGNKLFKKLPRDYPYSTYDVNACSPKVGYGTETQKLLSVMKKYRGKDNLYVIITDGDMREFFWNKELYQEFRDKTCVIGILDKEIKEKMPHHVELGKSALTEDDKKEVERIVQEIKGIREQQGLVVTEKEVEKMRQQGFSRKMTSILYSGNRVQHQKAIIEAVKTSIDILKVRIK